MIGRCDARGFVSLDHPNQQHALVETCEPNRSNLAIGHGLALIVLKPDYPGDAGLERGLEFGGRGIGRIGRGGGQDVALDAGGAEDPAELTSN